MCVARSPRAWPAAARATWRRCKSRWPTPTGSWDGIGLGVEDLDAALASARDRGNVMYRIWSLGQLCRSHIARGDLDAFHRHLAEYRTMMTDGDARATASDFNRVVHATSEAQAHLVAGDPHSAARWIDEAVGIAQKIAVPQFYFMEVPGALGDALLWAWRLSPSPGLARLARRNARLGAAARAALPGGSGRRSR